MNEENIPENNDSTKKIARRGRKKKTEEGWKPKKGTIITFPKDFLERVAKAAGGVHKRRDFIVRIVMAHWAKEEGGENDG